MGEIKVKLSKRFRRKLPILQWLPHCTINTVIRDCLSGITVALTEIPQSITYAGIAGLPLQYGIFSSFTGGFIYAIFGNCPTVNMGVTSIIALILQEHVANFGPIISTLMSFLSGVIIFCFGLLQLGFLIDYFSYPVITGFTSAAALTIISSQMKNFFGVNYESHGFLQNCQNLIGKSHEIRPPDAILSAITLIVLCCLKECRFFLTRIESLWIRRVVLAISTSRNAVIVVILTILTFLLQRNSDIFRIVGQLDCALPQFELPEFSTTKNGTFYNFLDIVKETKTSLIFIPLIAILETIAVAKIFSQDRCVDASQEMIALGLANFCGSFVRSMPVSSSFSRTAINTASGAKTNLSGVFTGLFILLTSNWLNYCLYYVPKSVLAAVIISAMLYVVEYRAVYLLWKTQKIELIPFFITLLSCLLLGLEYGILIGISINLIFIINESSKPHILQQKSGSTHLITIIGKIQYPAAHYLSKTITKIEKDTITTIQINGAKIAKMDVTVVKSFDDLIGNLKRDKLKVELIGFQPEIRQIFVDFNRELSANFQENS